MHCIKCGVRIPDARLQLLPDTRTCVAHSTAQAYKGMLNFGHKTGGAVMPMQPETFRAMRRYTARRGKRSNMGSFLNHA